MCQVDPGAYVSLLAPEKTDYIDCYPTYCVLSKKKIPIGIMQNMQIIEVLNYSLCFRWLCFFFVVALGLSS